MKLFIATGNAGKLREIRGLVEEYFSQFDSIEGRAPRDAEESEATFVGNALIKARALVDELKGEGLRDFWVLSDDSGLEVDLLNGAPGVHSARYAGDHVDPQAHMQKLLRELATKSKVLTERRARYRCALALVHERTPPEELVGEGACEGFIAFEPKGDSGFGYDPIFFSPDFNRTMSEVSYDEKNSVSHRRRAFESLRAQLESSSTRGAREPRS